MLALLSHPPNTQYINFYQLLHAPAVQLTLHRCYHTLHPHNEYLQRQECIYFLTPLHGHTHSTTNLTHLQSSLLAIMKSYILLFYYVQGIINNIMVECKVSKSTIQAFYTYHAAIKCNMFAVEIIYKYM